MNLSVLCGFSSYVGPRKHRRPAGGLSLRQLSLYFTITAGIFAPQLHTSAGAVKFASAPPEVVPAVVPPWKVISPVLAPPVIVAHEAAQFVVNTT